MEHDRYEQAQCPGDSHPPVRAFGETPEVRWEQSLGQRPGQQYREQEPCWVNADLEAEQVEQWNKNNNISFPVGMIKDNDEETKLNWGVKSLPWLILTDKEHVVQEEGFSVSEIEEKIK